MGFPWILGMQRDSSKAIPSSIRLHVILMCGGIYCGAHYSALKGKSYYKYAHIIYCK